MVKLIRLTTTDENAIFDNDFVPNILIPPKSSIALKSLALENVISKININSRNDKLQFQVSNAQGALETQLTHAEYDNITAPSLFRDMNTQINKQYDPNIEGSNVGIETECFVNNNLQYNLFGSGSSRLAFGGRRAFLCICLRRGHTGNHRI